MKNIAFRYELEEIETSLPYEMVITKKGRVTQDVTVDETYLNELTRKFLNDCNHYLNLWLEPLQPMKIWSWVALRKIPEWKDVEPCVDVLMKQKLLSEGDEVNIHTDYCNVKSVIESHMTTWGNSTRTETRWMNIFASLKEKDISFKYFFVFVEYAMAIPGEFVINSIWSMNSE